MTVQMLMRIFTNGVEVNGATLMRKVGGSGSLKGAPGFKCAGERLQKGSSTGTT